MNLKKNIYINLEILARELSSHLLLSVVALNKNFRVYIGDTYSIKKLLTNKIKKEGLFLAKGNIDKDLHKLVKKKCEKLVSLDQEISPGYSSKYYHKIIKIRYINLTNNFDLFLLNNNKIMKSFLEVFPINKEKVKVTGWPRFDLFRKEFLPLYSNKVLKIKKKYGRFYLFNSDFGHLTNIELKNKLNFIKKYVNDQKAINEVLNKYNINDFENFKKFLKELRKLKKLPKIIFRPHPAENLSEWENIKKIDPRFTINYPHNDVAEMILASDGVLHRGCTTAYQAMINKKKTGYINLTNGLKGISDFRKTLFKFSDKIINVNELQKWFNVKNKKKINKQIYNELNIKQKTSSEHIVDELEKLDISLQKKNVKFKLYHNFELKIQKYKNLIYNVLSYLKILEERNYFKLNSQVKIGRNFNKFFLKNQIKIISKILCIKKKITVSKISDNLFEIDM
ncbi:hypothetical protein OAO90_00030 [Candidatus Pelagibacter ubique]|jgi:surface carbohydrate biosynthesis protein|nr:hypothetical protein [Candidatus Pelagibacter ubique]